MHYGSLEGDRQGSTFFKFAAGVDLHVDRYRNVAERSIGARVARVGILGTILNDDQEIQVAVRAGRAVGVRAKKR